MPSIRDLREQETHVGQELPLVVQAITPELVQWYVDAVEDDHPWYHGGSPFGGPVAPALVLHNPNYSNGRSRLWYLPNLYGNLHAKQHWELYNPMLVGTMIHNRGLVVDRYLKRDREFVVCEGTLSDPSGQTLARVRSTQSFRADPDLRGVVVDRAPARPAEPRREPEAEPGELIAGKRHVVSVEQCDRFTGTVRNYHNDVAESQKLGFPEIVVVGSLSTCFIS